MADPLPIRVEGVDEVVGKLLLAPKAVRDAVFRAVETSAAKVTARAKAKLSDDVLHVQTGRLRRSIHYVIGGSETAPTATIGTNVEYAAIHEFGGRTGPHVIEAVNARVLAFPGRDGRMHFAPRVNHPGSRMPERSFLRSALAVEAAGIRERIEQSVKGVLP
jgi:phage gpG-like protein